MPQTIPVQARGGLSVALAGLAILFLASVSASAQPTRITVEPAKLGQEFQGLGSGAIFYEGHITSLAARGKTERQEQLYDDMFKHVNTRYLQLMIRHDHEPKNDNDDPFTQAFEEKNFAYCEHAIAIAKAALKRRPDMEFLATLYTPPGWMKTNNDPSGGGEARATLKAGMDLEFAEFAWVFVNHMQKNGVTIHYLAITNEPDWPHTQPACYFTAERHAELLKTVGEYFDKMATKPPKTPRPKFVSPNTLSAPGAAKDYLPAALKKAPRYVEVIGAHDYDPRGERWADLQKIAKGKPVWMTEWCHRDKDNSENMIDTAMGYAAAMSDSIGGGANVWMAYDWVYPGAQGESLIAVDWGNDYKLTKQYHLFRQWAQPLMPGMRLTEATVAGPGATARGKPGVKATAFLSADKKALVVHLANTQDKAAPISLKLTGPFAAVATAAASTRTSAKEDAADLPNPKRSAAGFDDTLPPKSLTTWRFEK
jgi:O-glycosyl hydrolase